MMAPRSTTMITLAILLLFATTTFTTTHAASPPPITALYVFGDSTVDPGNNNNLPTSLFKANHPPYGEDCPGRIPTGRFSDGLIASDYLANSLGLKKLIPAYLDPAVSDCDLLTGVSFASAGSGVDELTLGLTHALDLNSQVRNFEEATRRMVRTVGPQNTTTIVENAIFLISIGSNDILINYFDLPTRTLTNTPSTYSDFLQSRVQSTIEWLYSLGARKFAVAGMPPLGCLPIQVTAGSILPSTHWLQRVCVDEQNTDAIIYNNKLQSVLNRLRSRHPQGKFVYADIYNPLADMINRPHSYGFQTTLEGCCGTGILESGSLCNALDFTCPNPSSFVFWDSIHPTQAAHRVLANSLMTNVVSKLQ